jgi:hypothetical protein
MTPQELIDALGSATEGQKQQIRELVAPITKQQRLAATADALSKAVTDGYNAAARRVGEFAERVKAGDLEAPVPTMDELAKLFANPA